MDTLHQDDFDLALAYVSAVGVEVAPGELLLTRFPYDFYPGQTTNGNIVPLNNKDAWYKYVWNPPEYDTEHPDGQDNCIPKPTWAQLVQWAVVARREQAVKRLDSACESKITSGYGADSSRAEWRFRFRATEAGASEADKERLAAGNAERDRLRTRHRAITAWIYTLTDPDILRNLDFSDDEYWSATWTPPE